MVANMFTRRTTDSNGLIRVCGVGWRNLAGRAGHRLSIELPVGDHCSSRLPTRFQPGECARAN